MDPFSAEGELVNIHTAFIQGQYQSVLSDYTPSSYSAPNRLPVQVLQYRAQCALGQYSKVLSSVTDTDAKNTPDLAAVRTYASYLQKPTELILSQTKHLSEAQRNNLTVQLLCGTILSLAGQNDQALTLLSSHQGSLDAVALIIQIHLLQNRLDLALKEAKSARSFAQDALLVNLAESWIGMRQGGENYQKAFYVFEELAQGPSTASAGSLVAQAVAELHMGRLEEAETALESAVGLEGWNGEALANKLVLEAVLGRATGEREERLRVVNKEHEMLVGLAEKREAFRAAMEKYSPKFEP